MYRQFDIVQVLTTKRIRYLSGPRGFATSPQGNWSVVGFVGSDMVLAKEKTLIRVPISDVQKVAGYSPGKFFRELENAGMSESFQINMVEHLSEELGLGGNQAKKMLLDYNFKTEVSNIQERDQITQRIQKLIARKRDKHG